MAHGTMPEPTADVFTCALFESAPPDGANAALQCAQDEADDDVDDEEDEADVEGDDDDEDEDDDDEDEEEEEEEEKGKGGGTSKAAEPPRKKHKVLDTYSRHCELSLTRLSECEDAVYATEPAVDRRNTRVTA